ncbi:N-alpha-acetyltransferase 40 [Gryllus bimaculatus]|nr:N-alpha-acetyltransferase 40 [Gryllus bimaculatus]
MGRKSVKGKLKRAERQMEREIIAAAQKVVNAANEQEDPLAKLVAFKQYKKNDLAVTLECRRVEDLNVETRNWAFELLKRNMKDYYDTCSWGWNDRVKKEEMTDSRAWYLIARSITGDPVAFSHFRFDIDFMVEVLYCYEIQLEPKVQRHGLGKLMMQVLELIAFSANMKKVVLTALKHNPEALAFFRALKYNIDETSPEGDFEEYPYEILSKPNKILLKNIST